MHKALSKFFFTGFICLGSGSGFPGTCTEAKPSVLPFSRRFFVSTANLFRIFRSSSSGRPFPSTDEYICGITGAMAPIQIKPCSSRTLFHLRQCIIIVPVSIGRHNNTGRTLPLEIGKRGSLCHRKLSSIDRRGSDQQFPGRKPDLLFSQLSPGQIHISWILGKISCKYFRRFSGSSRRTEKGCSHRPVFLQKIWPSLPGPLQRLLHPPGPGSFCDLPSEGLPAPVCSSRLPVWYNGDTPEDCPESTQTGMIPHC